MTPITASHAPGDLSVVTFAAILPIDYCRHRDVTSALLHGKNTFMAGLALELHAMRPVWENDWLKSDFRHSVLVPIQYDISVFGKCRGRDQQQQRCYQ